RGAGPSNAPCSGGPRRRRSGRRPTSRDRACTSTTKGARTSTCWRERTGWAGCSAEAPVRAPCAPPQRTFSPVRARADDSGAGLRPREPRRQGRGRNERNPSRSDPGARRPADRPAGVRRRRLHAERRDDRRPDRRAPPRGRHRSALPVRRVGAHRVSVRGADRMTAAAFPAALLAYASACSLLPVAATRPAPEPPVRREEGVLSRGNPDELGPDERLLLAEYTDTQAAKVAMEAQLAEARATIDGLQAQI